MYSLDETQCQSLNTRGEKAYDKKNNIGIAVCGIIADTIG